MTYGNSLTFHYQNRSQHKKTVKEKSVSRGIHWSRENQVKERWRRVISSTLVLESTFALGMSSRTRWNQGIESLSLTAFKIYRGGDEFGRDMDLKLRLKWIIIFILCISFWNCNVEAFMVSDLKLIPFPIQK